MAAAAREAAFRALRAIASTRVDLGEALSSARDPLTDRRDRSLATDLTTGTLRWRGAIDYQLQLRSAKRLPTLDPAVLDSLRLGAYQILHLERVPVSAVVNDSVDLVKAAGFRSAAGFVNAVLRRVSRERDQLSWPDRSTLVEHLAIVHSHPEWLIARWLARYGEDATERWLRFNNEPPAMTLATNRLLGTREALAARLVSEHVETVPTLIAPHGLRVTSGRALASATFRHGYCLVQDEASQIVPELLRAEGTLRLLDVCASPGGKTIASAAQSGPGAMVVASDVRPRRVSLLASTIARCRATHVRIVHIDRSGPLPFRDGVFDRVLIDAPCSGLGTLRRDPDIRWRREPDQLPALSRAQLDLLQRARRVVASGGSIVYSTCSSEPEENEEVIAAFLREAGEFQVIPVEAVGVLPAIAAMQTSHGYLRTTPDHGLEAFFAAVLRKK
jgi:16S rRNA (cytosine967-C5)-methyltransferase